MREYIYCASRNEGHPKCQHLTSSNPIVARAYGWRPLTTPAGSVWLCPCHAAGLQYQLLSSREVIELTDADVVEVCS